LSQGIPRASLRKWALKKFRDKCSTVDLIASVTDLGDKSAIAIVTLLDVEPDVRYAGMLAAEEQYVKSCHAYLASLKKGWEAESDLAEKSTPS
jgi:hypothetical protein